MFVEGTVNFLPNAPVLFGQSKRTVPKPISETTISTAPSAALRRNPRRTTLRDPIALPAWSRAEIAARRPSNPPSTTPNSVRINGTIATPRLRASSSGPLRPHVLVVGERQIPRPRQILADTAERGSERGEDPVCGKEPREQR